MYISVQGFTSQRLAGQKDKLHQKQIKLRKKLIFVECQSHATVSMINNFFLASSEGERSIHKIV